jgi:hypothetical protein
MKASSERNQAEIPSQGHEGISDPHLKTSDGLHITMPSAGIEHGGFIKDSEGLNQTK